MITALQGAAQAVKLKPRWQGRERMVDREAFLGGHCRLLGVLDARKFKWQEILIRVPCI